MSLDASRAVWLYSEADGSVLLMALAIADFADQDGRAYPSVRRLAAMARITDRHARKALRKLVQLHELTVEPMAGPKKTNVYRLRLDRWPMTSCPVGHPVPQDRRSIRTGRSNHDRSSRTAPPVLEDCKPLSSATADPSGIHHDPSGDHRSVLRRGRTRAEPVQMPDEIRQRLLGSTAGQAILDIADRPVGK